MKVIDNYTLIQKVGEGNYGTVYRAKHKLKPEEFAVKIIGADKFHQNQKLQECTNNEVKVLSTIGHSEHIVRYYEMIKSKNNYYFVYEFCDGGTLMEKIKKQHSLPQIKALQIFRSLVEAFKVLNKNNIMHRDLKPENILFHQDKVKLGDFGFSKGFKREENLAKTMLGSPIYMAPQVLKGQPYTSKADIWSLGVILYEMLFGICPYQSNSIAQLINTIDTKGIDLPEETKVSEKTKKLIKKMLTKDYFRRISWVQLFSYKIDKNGQYIEEPQNEFRSAINERLTQTANKEQKTYSFFTAEPTVNHLSVEQNITPFGVRMGESKKTVSVPKEEKGKKFYSHNYMSIFERPIIKKDEERKEKKSKQKSSIQRQREYLNINSLNELPSITVPLTVSKYRTDCEIEYENNSEKRERMLSVHENCLKSLQLALGILEKDKRQVLNDCYILVKKVNKKLRSITQGIRITETNLLDIATMVNYEIIEVDRLLEEIKTNVEKQNIPKLEEKVLESSELNTSITNPEIKKHMQLLE